MVLQKRRQLFTMHLFVLLGWFAQQNQVLSVTPEEFKAWAQASSTLLADVDDVVGFSVLEQEMQKAPEIITQIDPYSTLISVLGQVNFLLSLASSTLNTAAYVVESKYAQCLATITLNSATSTTTSTTTISEEMCCDDGTSCETPNYVNTANFAPYASDATRSMIQINGSHLSVNTSRTCNEISSMSTQLLLDACASTSLAATFDTFNFTSRSLFYASKNGFFRSVPALQDAPPAPDPRLTPMLSISLARFRVVIMLLDVGSGVSATDLLREKTAISILLSLTTSSDYIQVWGVDADGIQKHSCLGSDLIRGTTTNIQELRTFAMNLTSRGSGDTNYDTAIAEAMSVIQNSKACVELSMSPVVAILGASKSKMYMRAKDLILDNSYPQIEVLGLSFEPSSRESLNTLACNSYGAVVTVAVGQEASVASSLYLLHRQDYSTLWAQRTDMGPVYLPAIGLIPLWFNHSFTVSSAASSTGYEPVIRLMLPLFSTSTSSSSSSTQYLGVIGTELPLALLQRILLPTLSPLATSFAALVTRFGDTLYHPLMPQTSYEWDVALLENDQLFLNHVRPKLLAGVRGSYSGDVMRHVLSGSPYYEGFETLTVPSHYVWGGTLIHPKASEFFNVFVVLSEAESRVTTKEPRLTHLLPSLYYHVISLYNGTGYDVNLSLSGGGSTITWDQPVFKLAPSQWDDSDNYLSRTETRDEVVSIHEYANAVDWSQNPGFDAQAKQILHIVNPIAANHWKGVVTRNTTLNMTQVYFATPEGSFLLYPGSSLPNWYDASQRTWYVRAVASLSSVAISSPYLDAGGFGGTVVTVSRTVCKHPPCTSSADIQFVGGYDMPFASLVSSMMSVIPACDFQSSNSTSSSATSNETVLCLLIDKSGLLLMHWSFIDLVLSSTSDPSSWPIQNVFIGALEGALAKQLIADGVIYQSCVNHTSILQTVCFFVTNTPLIQSASVISGSIQQGGCVQGNYLITQLPNTTSFLIALTNYSKTCDDVPVTATAPSALTLTPCALHTFIRELDLLVPWTTCVANTSAVHTDLTDSEIWDLEKYRQSVSILLECATESYVGYGSGLGITALALAGIGLAFALMSLAWIVIFWNHPVVRRTSNAFNSLSLLGILHGHVFIVLSVGRPTIEKCHSRIYIIVLSFGILFGSLFAKTWRLYRIFNNPSLGRRHVRDREVLRLVLFLTLPALTILVLWSNLDPPNINQHVTIGTRTIDSFLACGFGATSKSTIFLTLLAIWVLGVLVFGSFLLFQVNEAKEFSERKYISMIIYTTLLLAVLAIPLELNVSPIAQQVVEVFIVFYTMFSSTALLFLSKVRRMFSGKYSDTHNSTPSPTANNAVASKHRTFPKDGFQGSSNNNSSSGNNNNNHGKHAIAPAAKPVSSAMASLSPNILKPAHQQLTANNIDSSTPTPQHHSPARTISKVPISVSPASGRGIVASKPRSESMQTKIRALSLALSGKAKHGKAAVTASSPGEGSKNGGKRKNKDAHKSGRFSKPLWIFRTQSFSQQQQRSRSTVSADFQLDNNNNNILDEKYVEDL